MKSKKKNNPETNPAVLLGRLSAKKNPKTPEYMRKLALLRWDKQKSQKNEK